MNANVRGWFVTGTDTGVGKTAVAEALLAALARSGRRAVGMKPVASGCRYTAGGWRSEDAEKLLAAGSVKADYEDINPYAFEPAIAPHVAAEQVGVEMQLASVHRRFMRLASSADWVIVEGAGGWQVPFNRRESLSDVARTLGLPVLLVVGLRLGCINHALLTARAIRAEGLDLAGWVANTIAPGFDTARESIAALDERVCAPRVAIVPYGWGDDSARYGEAMLRRLTEDPASSDSRTAGAASTNSD